MSPHHHNTLSLLPPPNNLRIDLNRFLHHYYIYRSFERNYTFENIYHIIGYRPVLGSLAAGDHISNTETPQTRLLFLFYLSSPRLLILIILLSITQTLPSSTEKAYIVSGLQFLKYYPNQSRIDSKT